MSLTQEPPARRPARRRRQRDARPDRLRRRRPERLAAERPPRPARPAQAGRAGRLHGHPRRLPDRDDRRPRLRPRRQAGQARRPRAAPPRRAGVFDLTPTEDEQMLVDVVTEFAAEVVRPAAAEADDGLRRARRRCSRPASRSGCRSWACPRSSAASPRSGRRWPAPSSPRRWRRATWAWPSPTLAPGAVATAIVAVGHRRAAADLPPGVHRRRRPGRRAGADRAAPRSSTRSTRRPPRPATATATSSTA